MARITIGLRHLYLARGFAVEGVTGFHHKFQCRPGSGVEIRIGGKPLYGHFHQTAPRYIAPEDPPPRIEMLYEPDISKTDLHEKTLTEIIVFKEVEVDDQLHQRLDAGDQRAADEALNLVVNHQDLAGDARLVAGLLGLRLHPQLVLELLTENAILWRPDENKIRHHSPAIQILEAVTLPKSAQPLLTNLLDTIPLDESTLDFAGRLFGWLLRAWREADPINRFLWLLLPLERVVGSAKPPPPDAAKLEAIRLAIEVAAPPSEKEGLLSLFKRMSRTRSPTLVDRFEAFARESQSPRADADIEAFREFNKIRNKLMHQGNPGVRLRVEHAAEKQVSTLQDLAERYVCFALFGDWNVYPSRWRPKNGA